MKHPMTPAEVLIYLDKVSDIVTEQAKIMQVPRRTVQRWRKFGACKITAAYIREVVGEHVRQ